MLCILDLYALSPSTRIVFCVFVHNTLYYNQLKRLVCLILSPPVIYRHKTSCLSTFLYFSSPHRLSRFSPLYIYSFFASHPCSCPILVITPAHHQHSHKTTPHKTTSGSIRLPPQYNQNHTPNQRQNQINFTRPSPALCGGALDSYARYK